MIKPVVHVLPGVLEDVLKLKTIAISAILDNTIVLISETATVSVLKMEDSMRVAQKTDAFLVEIQIV